MSAPSPTTPERRGLPAWLLIPAAAGSWLAFLFVQVSAVIGLKNDLERAGREPTELQLGCFRLAVWFAEYWWLLALPALALLAGFGVLYAASTPGRRRVLGPAWLLLAVALPLVVGAISLAVGAG